MRALNEIAKILPPLTQFFDSNRVIQFKEVGKTGFGDRLRGISLLMLLSRLYKVLIRQEAPSALLLRLCWYASTRRDHHGHEPDPVPARTFATPVH